MRKSILVLVAATAILIGGCGSGQEDMKVGDMIHGFKLVKQQFVKELDADCYLFQHEKSGAELLKVAAKDDNKTFSIAFKTPPPDDTGLPHIMEHSVLNGSENFPVKSPFDVLMQGSLQTFLNAMTSSDFTVYPVSSRNMKDYFNLMHVYLDATLKPLLHKDERILKQEGWHFELENPDAPLVYKGVVYNEMKGAFSSPTRQLGFLLYRQLFPDNNYGKSSGGWPAAIPELTYEQFKNFHKRYYHPANSYILVYGDADMEKELEFIDANYLSGFDAIEVDSDIPVQATFKAPRTVRGEYGVPEGTSTKGQTYLGWATMYGRNTDQETTIALDILSDALVNNESAPLRRALREAGIGKEVNAYVDNIQQNVFQLTVQNAEVGDLEKFHQVVKATLEKVIADGFDRDVLEGLINRMEFQLREGRGSWTGIMAAMGSLPGWMFADDPFISLEYEKPLESIKAKVENNYFEDLAKKSLLDNPHAATVVLEPVPGLERKRAEAVQRELAERKAKMSEEEIANLVKETKELVAYQQREDSPEALATIPLLEIGDIEKKEEEYVLKKQQVEGVDLLAYNEFSKGIVYLDFYFDASAVPVDHIPYLQLYNELLGMLDTKELAYSDLENEINRHTGGINTRVQTYLVERDDNRMQPYFMLSGKVMPGKLDKLLHLADQQLNHTLWETDPERLESLVRRMKARAEMMLSRNGMGTAAFRLFSYFTNSGSWQDRTNGLEYYRFLAELTKNYDARSEELVTRLKEIHDHVVRRNGMFVSVVCHEDDMTGVSKTLPPFIKGFSQRDVESVALEFPKQALNEGFKDASKVQYVLKGYDYKQLGAEYSGAMEVLQQVLSRVYLQNRIRVIGGAYGGFARIEPSGALAFFSYRDPNLRKTVENYKQAGEFLRKFEPTEPELRRLIIGTIAGRDRPLTPQQKGRVAVERYITQIPHATLQQERDEILTATAEQIRGYADLIDKVMEQEYLCVVGNEKKIEEQKDLFKTVTKLRD